MSVCWLWVDLQFVALAARAPWVERNTVICFVVFKRTWFQPLSALRNHLRTSMTALFFSMIACKKWLSVCFACLVHMCGKLRLKKVSFFVVLRKKGSKTKKRTREEEIEKGDYGPPAWKVYSRFCRTWTKRYLITSLTRVKRVSRIFFSFRCQINWWKRVDLQSHRKFIHFKFCRSTGMDLETNMTW